MDKFISCFFLIFFMGIWSILIILIVIILELILFLNLFFRFIVPILINLSLLKKGSLFLFPLGSFQKTLIIFSNSSSSSSLISWTGSSVDLCEVGIFWLLLRGYRAYICRSVCLCVCVLCGAMQGLCGRACLSHSTFFLLRTRSKIVLQAQNYYK